MKNRYIFSFISVFVFAIGVTAGWFFRVEYVNHQSNKLTEVRENDNKYRYINPLLLVDVPKEAPEYGLLKNSISNFTDSEIKNGDASSISVYFRDLNSGRWTGVNPDQAYDPSSMLKVAVMIDYLHKAADNQKILFQKLPYNPVVDPGQNYKPEHQLQGGEQTIRDLISAMIVDSDNNALISLFNNDKEALANVLKTLEIPPPNSVQVTDFMSPKKYSALFRTLYSSTYLPRAISEEALHLLTYTTFKKGLVAGLPENTIVAHKFGEHTTLDINQQIESRQLHDCGIIYYPQKPYLLCVMTKGKDFSRLEKIISNISNITYRNISG